jgi:hypothetical protein
VTDPQPSAPSAIQVETSNPTLAFLVSAFDGQAWTAHVSDPGTTATDPL